MRNIKKHRRFLLLLTMLSAATFAIAQNITGRIIDEQSQPMPFANVMLVNRTDSVFIAGAVTKDDGTFNISTDKQDGLLKVSSVGYILMYIDARQGNVGDIQMQPDTQTLGEVVVKGRLTMCCPCYHKYKAATVTSPSLQRVRLKSTSTTRKCRTLAN